MFGADCSRDVVLVFFRDLVKILFFSAGFWSCFS